MLTLFSPDNPESLIDIVDEGKFEIRAEGGGIIMYIQRNPRRMILGNGVMATEVDQVRAKGRDAAQYMLDLALFVNPNFNVMEFPADGRKFFQP